LSSVARRASPEVSVIVVVYNMARAAPRTLFSLSADYQRHIAADDYEVIVVDNGSTPPLDPRILDGLNGNFRLIYIDSAPSSPAHAVNRGLAEARGDVIGVMVDGARMLTPGVLHFARHGAKLYDRSVVATLTWHLGFDGQMHAVVAGYDNTREDALLQSIGWPQDGYRLFEIGALVGSSTDGWLQPLSESNALFLRRETWDLLGGMDERFDEQAGGFVNLDLFRRAVELPGAQTVVLLGEGTFHQLHGMPGTNPNNSQRGPAAERGARFAAQFAAIRGRPWSDPVENSPRTYLGTLVRPALARFVRAALDPVRIKLGDREPPLGRTFDRSLWSLTPISRPSDPIIAGLVDLAHAEFRAGRYEAAAAVARLARQRAPDEPEPQRLLAQSGVWLPMDTPPADRRAEVHVALGDAYRVLGKVERSKSEYHAGLTFEANLARAHIGLSMLRMPGPFYLDCLANFHRALSPETYVEIGVAAGASLALARPPTRAIGIDPAPRITTPFQTETHIFAETTDAFFAAGKLARLLDGRPLVLGFIDGSHLFEQALKDFMNLEAYCGPRSVLLLHDTVPRDEATQTRERRIGFHSGDIWKTVLCLKHYRPDLDIFTIATPWTGLTVVTGLDPGSRVLTECFDEAVGRFVGKSFGDIENCLDEALNIVPNNWDIVAARLKQRNIL
jgi:hypothetical protein